MPRGTQIGAALLAALLVLSVATPAVLASEEATISVEQGDTTYTVTVDHNGTAVNDTTVNVTPIDSNATYAGDTGVTDENGSVTFDLPENETEVTITADWNDSTVSTTETLAAANDSDDGQGAFGQWVSQLVEKLKTLDPDGPLGQLVSAEVTENNPGADHRSDEANPGGNGNGPPDHAGNSSSGGNGGGPPDHAKGGQDDGEEDSTPTATPDS